MSSDEIIETLELTGKLIDLHEDNSFKSKAYANAAFRLNKLRYDFAGKSKTDIEGIEGIGKGMAAKILELLEKGSLSDLQVLLKKTPTGVIDMLGIKGLGPKKVKALWQELHIESVGELLYACHENRLVTLKGFGDKTQKSVQQSIEFKLANHQKFHYAAIEKPVMQLMEAIRAQEPGIQIGLLGEMARKVEVIEKIDILIDRACSKDYSAFTQAIPLAVTYHLCDPSVFYYRLVEGSSTPAHLEQINFQHVETAAFTDEAAVYASVGLPYIPVELREGLEEVRLAKNNTLPTLLETNDLKGVLHNHSTYSDGVHTLKEMADYCQSLGYTYFGICDHSKSAFYANGLSIERVLVQQAEIDQLNNTYSGFKILKGIESDILNDGALDYPDDVLKTFDFVVASVHSNLKMNEEKANQRLLKAIENPYTSILGHPTGRLLLARPGYPIDHKKIIDACAANGVSIELNAHPYRLDIDWRWIPYCMEKGVKIAINPDAHHKEGFHDMYFGVCVARKGLLTKEQCLNALPLNDLLNSFKK
jgi:DNA polymerase (family 10)